MNWLHKVCFPILRDESGRPRPVYHGTNSVFDKFEKQPSKRYVLFTEFPVESPGHFFSENPDDAQQYGRNVMKRYLDINKILLDPKDHPHMGVDRFPPELEKELQYILEPMIQESPEHGKWIDIGVSTYPVKEDGDWIYAAVGSNGLNWDVLDNPAVVNRMKELGYDATYVHEDNGRSIFVVDSKQIVPESELHEVD